MASLPSGFRWRCAGVLLSPNSGAEKKTQANNVEFRNWSGILEIQQNFPVSPPRTPKLQPAILQLSACVCTRKVTVPAKQKLVRTFGIKAGSSLTPRYALVVVMPISSFGLDGLVGLIKAKASTNVVLSFLFGYALGTTCIGAMLCIQLLMVLGGACSREQTSIIGRAAQSVVVLLTLGAGSVLAVRVGVMGYHGGVASSCLACVFMMMALWLIHAGHRRAQEVHALWRRWR